MHKKGLFLITLFKRSDSSNRKSQANAFVNVPILYIDKRKALTYILHFANEPYLDRVRKPFRRTQ